MGPREEQILPAFCSPRPLVPVLPGPQQKPSLACQLPMEQLPSKSQTRTRPGADPFQAAQTLFFLFSGGSIRAEANRRRRRPLTPAPAPSSLLLLKFHQAFRERPPGHNHADADTSKAVVTFGSAGEGEPRARPNLQNPMVRGRWEDPRPGPSPHTAGPAPCLSWSRRRLQAPRGGLGTGSALRSRRAACSLSRHPVCPELGPSWGQVSLTRATGSLTAFRPSCLLGTRPGQGLCSQTRS